jgi:hypothetical protein
LAIETQIEIEIEIENRTALRFRFGFRFPRRRTAFPLLHDHRRLPADRGTPVGRGVAALAAVG